MKKNNILSKRVSWKHSYFLKLFYFILFNIIFLIILDLIDIRQYINFSIEYDWLNFYGAILGGLLGGLLTMIGVSESLKFQKESDKVFQRLNVIPIFKYNVKKDSEIIAFSYQSLDDSKFTLDPNITIRWRVNLSIKNIGIGHARKIEYAIRKNNVELPGFTNFGQNDILQIGDTYTTTIGLYKTREFVEHRNNNHNVFNNHQIFITIYYNDLLNNHYKQTISLSLSESRGNLDDDTSHQREEYIEIVDVSEFICNN